MPATSADHEDVEYIPLLADDSHLQNPPSVPKFHNVGHHHRFLHILSIAVLLVSIASVSWSAVRYTALIRATTFRKLDIGSLHRPSLYIGLDRVVKINVTLNPHSTSQAEGIEHAGPSHHPSPSPAPPLSAGIEAPFEIVRLSSDQVRTHDGWVLLTQKDTTFMKFQPARGSSSCVLKSYFPSRRDLGDNMLTLEGRGARIHTFLPGSTLDLNHVVWDSYLGTQLGTFSAEFASSDAIGPFPCTHNAPVIVALTCPDDNCRVEYEVNNKQPPIGVYLTAAQTPH